jgi:hypothetical protein
MPQPCFDIKKRGSAGLVNYPLPWFDYLAGDKGVSLPKARVQPAG